MDRNWNTKLLMNERPIMVQNYARVKQIKVFSMPSEIKFTEAKKLRHEWNSEKLNKEKEQRRITVAINHLEKSFVESRNKINFPAFQPDERKVTNLTYENNKINISGKEKLLFVFDRHQYYKNVKNIYGTIGCERKAPQNCFLNIHINQTQPLMGSTEDGGSMSKSISIIEDMKLPNNKPRDASCMRHYPSEEMKISNKYLDLYECTQNLRGNKLNTTPRSIMFLKKVNKSKEIVSERTDESFIVRTGEGRDKMTWLMYKWKVLYYWKIWKESVSRKKNDKRKLLLVNKIDLFLERLTETNSLRAFHKDLKMQNEIKIYSKKKQTRVGDDTIKTLQIQTIENELRESQTKAYESIEKGLKTFHANLQPKVKAMSTLPTVKRKLQCVHKKIYPIPEFILKMENRYKERKKIWMDIQEKKKKIQAENEKIQKEREAEKVRIEKLKKMEEMSELKEQRRLRKIAIEESEKKQQLIKDQIKISQAFYSTYLVRKVGFEPWRKLILMRNTQFKRAILHSEQLMTRALFKHWWQYVHKKVGQKYCDANQLYKTILLRNTFQLFIINYNESVKRYQVGMDWYDAKLTEKTFRIWLKNFQETQRELEKKEEAANSSYARNVTNKLFVKWKHYLEFVRNEKEKEKRKRIWQRKVLEFLPDYQPACASEM